MDEWIDTIIIIIIIIISDYPYYTRLKNHTLDATNIYTFNPHNHPQYLYPSIQTIYYTYIHVYVYLPLLSV